ncbi:MAG TPA: type IV pilus assembly protein PilM [Tepidisphaeraceae bacterium]|nr:type IV pilus assembly protein PilM [Tepidisphaeraceae bacterium]
MATARFAWGIDIGNRALKAVCLVRDGETLRIDDFDIIEHEHVLSDAGDNRESLIQTALANFSQRHSFKGGAVAIGVSGQSSFARFIKLPPVEPGKIPEIVKFEAIQQIPFPLEDVEWSYQLFQTPDSPEVEVGIFAMRKELVNQTIKNFNDVGLQVQTVQMNPLAVYNALYHDDRLKGTSMIVDVGAENSDLIIAEGENIWMRSIPIGGNNFTEALVKNFKLKFPKAEELKRNAATSKYGRQILQAMKPVFSDLVGEIQRSIGFYSSTHRDSRIARVLALGGTFRLPGLQKYLQQNLQMDVARIDRLGTTSPDADAKFAALFNENILSAVSAYGLALQAMGQAKISSSLLPEKIRRERMWQEKTKWFAAAAAMFIAGTSVAVGSWYAQKLAAQTPAAQDALHDHESVGRIAKGLATTWSGIESSGKDDRAKVGNYMAMTNHRDIEPQIIEQICTAFPTAPPPAVQKKIPRSQRQDIELLGWVEVYHPDIAMYLEPKMSQDEFTKQGDTNFESNYAPPDAANANAFNPYGGGAARGRYNPIPTGSAGAGSGPAAGLVVPVAQARRARPAWGPPPPALLRPSFRPIPARNGDFW